MHASRDTKSLPDTLKSNLQELRTTCCERIRRRGSRRGRGQGLSRQRTSWLSWSEYRSYISEPERGGRKWKDKQAEQAATYANRRRIRGTRGKRLIRRRGELLERPFAHYLEAGGCDERICEDTKIYSSASSRVAGFNLGILMRTKATPKEYAELNASLIAALLRFVSTIGARRPAAPSGVSTWPFRRITSSLNLPTKLSP